VTILCKRSNGVLAPKRSTSHVVAIASVPK